MSDWEENTMSDCQENDGHSQQTDEDKPHRPGGHGRPGSPYPRRLSRSSSLESVTCVTTTTTMQVLVEQSNNIIARPTPARGLCFRPGGSSQRTTSIKWAENLPVPDRRLSLSPSDESVPSTSSSTVQGYPLSRSKNNNSQTCGQTPLNTPEYEEQQGAEKEATILEAKNQQDDDARKLQLSQLSRISQLPRLSQDTDTMTSIGRPMAPSIRALQEESVIQENFQDECENKSMSTHPGGDPASRLPPHLAHRAVAPAPDPLTCEVLDSLGEKHGDVAQSKKSHHSWDVSEGEDNTSGNEGSSNHIDYHPQFGIALWISHWVNCLPSEPATVSLQDSDESIFRHGIDPETGEFMAYIEQPDTWTNFEEEKKLEPGALRRRREWTSNFIVRRERAVRENLERRQQEAKEKEYKRTVVRQTQQLAVKPSTAGTQVKATRSANGVMPAKSNNSGAMSSTAQKTRSVAGLELRLGFLSDAHDCAAIYNLAVSAHAPLPDNHPISSQRFEFMFNECLREKLPFVVAVAKKADLTDAKNWPSIDAFRQYMQWRQSQPEEETATSTIYGFAFLSPYERGLGFGSGAAAETVKATVFVHPEHRRHGVGSALLDRLLVETSILYHGGDIQYQWKEPDTHDAFERSSFRQVHRIVMHGMVDGDRENPDWMNSFMKSFQFEKAGRVNQVYKVVTPHTVEWYDQVIWVHWAKKISNGPVCDAGEESECSYDYPGKSRAQFAQSIYQV